ncbi:MAG TPA: hypothetical protein VK671_05495 [Mucilaginibacter sp.]|jgi:hypothetical protein|nr:hypothetical protein [Mucilaginibacter sp.]
MKKILLTTIVLLAFTVSILLFQMSCKKEANAQSTSYILTPATTSKLGGVIPDGTTISVDGNGKISTVNAGSQQNKILYTIDESSTSRTAWTANSDGTSPQKINIVLPAGKMINGITALSPDHKTIYFTTVTTTAPYAVENYTCSIDGSNLQKLQMPALSQIYVAY